MAFALIYNDADLNMFEGLFVAASMDNQNRVSKPDTREAQRYWNGGISGWRTAPEAPAELTRGDDGTGGIVRLITVTYGTKADFIALMRRVAATDNSWMWLSALADDVTNNAVEPWP